MKVDPMVEMKAGNWVDQLVALLVSLLVDLWAGKMVGL